MIHQLNQSLSPPVADPEFSNGADGRGAKGAEVVESREGVCPLPRKKMIFLPETSGFWCILGLLFTFKKA